MPKEPSAPPINFECALNDLEQLVTRMESGELSLEEALKQFEQGIKLVQSCQKTLLQAEQKVNQLIEKDKDGQWKTAPFNTEENDATPKDV